MLLALSRSSVRPFLSFVWKFAHLLTLPLLPVFFQRIIAPEPAQFQLSVKLAPTELKEAVLAVNSVYSVGWLTKPGTANVNSTINRAMARTISVTVACKRFAIWPASGISGTTLKVLLASSRTSSVKGRQMSHTRSFWLRGSCNGWEQLKRPTDGQTQSPCSCSSTTRRS